MRDGQLNGYIFPVRPLVKNEVRKLMQDVLGKVNQVLCLEGSFHQTFSLRVEGRPWKFGRRIEWTSIRGGTAW